MISYELISERLISATFETSEGPLTVFEVYAPDTSHSDDIIEDFYDHLQVKINELPSKSKFTLIGDFNAKVGADQHEAWAEATGRYGLGKANDRVLYFLQFCAINKLVISKTLYRHNEARRATWLPPDTNTMNQIDYIIIQEKIKPYFEELSHLPLRGHWF